MSAAVRYGSRALFAILGALVFAGAGVADDESDEARLKQDELSEKARTMLQKRCGGCHGQDINFPGLDFENFESVYADRGANNFKFIEPKDPSRSLIWQAVDVEKEGQTPRMPQNAPPLTQDERAILRDWILAGAPVPPQKFVPREYISELDVLTTINTYLNSPKFRLRKERELVRFFTIHHLHNDWKHISEERLRITRAALSKSINCTSRTSRLVIPQAIDDKNTIYAVDISELGWNDDLWQAVQKVYPYRTTPIQPEEFAEFERIKQAYGAAAFPGATHVRADWFSVTAVDARKDPERKSESLYDQLLGNPTTLPELEKRLGVNRPGDFLANTPRMVRGGVIQSGVSAQNRLVDGHSMENRPGWYWISYDFQRQSGRGNIIRFPLGPKSSAGTGFTSDAFEHGGNEIIYPLTNGMHGYFLVDDKEARIEAGPISIVSDKLKTSGTPEIVNGLSCIACHKHGMIDFKDVVRGGSALQGQSLQKLRDLYDPVALNDALVQTRQQYLVALEKTLKPFLATDDGEFDVTRVPEPISTVSRWYLADIDLDAVACEIGVKPEALQGAIEGNLELQRLGLGLLLKDHGRMKRTMWTADEKGVTAYQAVLQAMGRGNP
jgi:serine/threonine-protein kinase